MKRLYSLFIAIFSISTLCGQQAEWAHFFAGPLPSLGIEVKADAQGNVYSIGAYTFYAGGTVDFDPGPALNGFTQPVQSSAFYISKFNAAGNYVWARSFALTQPGNASIQQFTIDNDGNLICAGYFGGIVDFDLGPGVNIQTANYPYLTFDPEGLNCKDLYIAKYALSGNLIWIKTFPSSHVPQPGFGSLNAVYGLELDAENNIIIASKMRGEVDLNPNDLGGEIETAGYNTLIAKFTNSGDYIWAKLLGSGSNAPSSVAVDAFNNILVSGTASGTVDYDTGPEFNNVNSTSLNDSYIIKLNPNGETMWINKIFGPQNGYGGCSEIHTDTKGNVLATGFISNDSLYFQSASDSLVLLHTSFSGSVGTYQGFVTKIDSNGHFLWIKQLTSNSEIGVCGTQILNDSVDNIYTLGVFSDSADFNYSGGGDIHTAEGTSSAFVLKMDEHGNYIRTSVIDGDIYVKPTSFYIDQDASLYFTGSFEALNSEFWGTVGTGHIDFDPGPDTLPLIGWGTETAVVYETVFLAKWSQCKANSDTLSQAVCNSYLWNNQTYTESGSYSKTFTTPAGCDSAAVLLLTINSNTQATQNLHLCASDSVSIGNQILHSSGIYTSMLINSQGCDSVLTTTLLVDSLNPQVSLIDNIYSALNLPEQAQVQWLNCFPEYSAVSGENQPVFIPTETGSYAFELTSGGCRDTSDCVSFVTVLINNKEAEIPFSLLPLPFTDELTILLNNQNYGPIRIYSATGQCIFSDSSVQPFQTIATSSWPAGLYFIQIQGYSRVIIKSHP